MENEKEAWAGYIGGLILIIIFGTLALVAAGGWNWFTTFLANSAPAWIQAFGSIFAIVAAIYVVNRQHTLQIKKDENTEKLIIEHRKSILYQAVKCVWQTSDYIQNRIHDSNSVLLLEQYKKMYTESRMTLYEFPILEIHDPKLARKIMELNQFLIMNNDTFLLGKDAIEFGLSEVTRRCTRLQTTFWPEENILKE